MCELLQLVLGGTAKKATSAAMQDRSGCNSAMYLPSPASSRKVRRKLGGRKATARPSAVILLRTGTGHQNMPKNWCLLGCPDALNGAPKLCKEKEIF